MINEEYKNRIQRLSGIIISESKKKIIIDKIFLPEDIASIMDSEYGVYSIWVANSFKKLMIKRVGRGGNLSFDGKSFGLEFGEDFENEFNNLLKHDKSFQEFISDIFKNNYKGDFYDYIIDWIRGRSSGVLIERDKLDFKTLTFENAYMRAQKWHRALGRMKTEKIIDEEGDVIMTFPDGFYWIRLNKSVCNDESKAMGHCGRGAGTLFSLRKGKYPVITADIDGSGKILQMRGRANSKPKEIYHPYIFDFIMSDFVSGFRYNNYKVEDNFYIIDLKDESKIQEILDKIAGNR